MPPVIASPLIGFGRLSLRRLDWLWGRSVELSQCRTQRIQARGVGEPVVFYRAPNGCCYRDKLVIGEVN